MTNCPNCGAPAVGSRCEYCGTPLEARTQEQAAPGRITIDSNGITFYANNRPVLTMTEAGLTIERR